MQNHLSAIYLFHHSFTPNWTRVIFNINFNNSSAKKTFIYPNIPRKTHTQISHYKKDSIWNWF